MLGVTRVTDLDGTHLRIAQPLAALLADFVTQLCYAKLREGIVPEQRKTVAVMEMHDSVSRYS